MAVRILPYVDDLVPLVVGLASTGALAALVGLDRDLLARAGLASIGSAFVAYGLREVLRAWGGGYYCCNHAFYAGVGLAIAALGWLFLVAALRHESLVST